MSDFDIESWLEETEEKYNELKSSMQIDRHTLDDAMEQQPHLYSDVSELMAMAISYRDQSKAWAEETSNKIEQRIRKDMIAAGEKKTDKSIASEVSLDDEYLDAQYDYLDIKRMADKCIGLKDSFEQRSRMIKYMCDMYISGYWTLTGSKSAETSLKDHAADANKAEGASKRRAQSASLQKRKNKQKE